MADPLRDTLEIRFGYEELAHLNQGLTALTYWLRGYRSAVTVEENGPPGLLVLDDILELFGSHLRDHDRKRRQAERDKETTP